MDNTLIDNSQQHNSRLLSRHTFYCFMKHLLPFLTGFVAFVIISGVFYMGIMP